MKHLAAALLLFAVACGKSKAVEAPTTTATDGSVESAASTTTASTGTPSRRAAGEGAMCGGIGGIPCAEGLVCKMTGPMHPDKAGTCVKGD